MTVSLKIEHRGDPYEVDIIREQIKLNEQYQIGPMNLGTLKQIGDSINVTIWNDNKLIIQEREVK